MKSEKCIHKYYFDLEIPFETERKFISLQPAELAPLLSHESKVAIEQVYISTPEEPFSLRLRSTATDDGYAYEATLKDRGTLETDGIRRLEVTTPISAELYDFYAADTPAVLRKIRVEPLPDIVVDFYEDGTVQLESEHPGRWREFAATYDAAVSEVTGLPAGDSEHRAYRGVSYDLPPAVSIEKVIDSIIEKKQSTSAPVFVHIGGRSGSGKSTIVQEIVRTLSARGVTSDVLSTDDYHRGQSWLTDYNNGEPWLHWDEPIVYDTEAMAKDLAALRAGQTVTRRTINWHTVEPQYGASLSAPEVIIIEGIYALASEITDPVDIVVELPTPLATCIGRRLLRDLKERPQFADPSASLIYMLSEVEPAYRRQRGYRHPAVYPRTT